MTQKWIGPDENLKVGDVGFLIEFSNPYDSSERYELRDTPAITTGSRMPQLEGWCGSYNNLATYGRGMVKVIRVASNGRCLTEELAGIELVAALEELGYPELIEQI